ncbi:WD40 repeat, subgroup [Ktedonobacter racemifer DSM 44963]|uniref:WD40 repeat, subgroup n=1 Tax=Ktedonobacter racemifer DSM 44963 TaxID=485913 RepID=D6TWS5_KTERA|nr:WD40 repeat, subgroup [Ktedonobacter racemifer DSM 44963]
MRDHTKERLQRLYVPGVQNSSSSLMDEQILRSQPKEREVLSFAQKGFSRRSLLLGGVISGVALASASCGFNLLPQIRSQGKPTSNHLLRSINWDGLDFSWLSDSLHIAYASNRGLFVVNVENGQRRWQQKIWPGYDYTSTWATSWSKRGTTVAYVGGAALLVQEVESGQNVWTHRYTSFPERRVALSPDGTRIAFSLSPDTTNAAHQPGIVQVWDVQHGTMLSQYPTSLEGQEIARVNDITWSPNGAFIASACQDGSVHVWGAADAHLLWRYDASASSGPCSVLGWSPDGNAIVFAASGKTGKSLLGVWNARTGRVRLQTNADVGVTAQNGKDRRITWSPDGTRMAFGVVNNIGSAIDVWSLQGGRRLFTCEHVSGQPLYVTWSPDGKYLAAGNYIAGSSEPAQGDNGSRSVVQFWDASSGQALFTYSAPKNPDQLAWSPDSRYLALITPLNYGILSNKTCLSLCRYGYEDYTLQVFRVP